MGLSSRSNQNGFFINIKGLKEGEKIRFECKPFGAAKEDEPDVYDTVSGILTKVKISTGTLPSGKEIPKISISLKDGKDVFIISSGFTSIARSIINSLLSYNDGEVSISVYENKKGFSSVAVNCNEDRLDWFFELDELNSYVTTVETDDGPQKQFGKLNNFLIEKLNEKLIPMLDAKSEVKEQEKNMISEQDEAEINAANKDIAQEQSSNKPGDVSNAIEEDENELPF